jgi:hypothetical protein
MDESLVDTSLAPLSECFCAAVNITSEWFGAGVREIVFDQILLEGKRLVALLTFPVLVDLGRVIKLIGYLVDLHMSLETEFGPE